MDVYKSKTDVHSFDYLFDASNEMRKGNDLSIYAIEDMCANEDRDVKESYIDYWIKKDNLIF